MDAKSLLIVFICLIIKVSQTCGELCYDPYTADFLNCDSGCCGSDDYKYCCIDPAVEEYSEVGEIIGGVIGGLIFLAIVVSIIVAICCCLRSRRSRPGAVMTSGVTMHGQTNMTMYPAAASITSYPTNYPTNSQYPVGQASYPGNQPSVAGYQSPSPGVQPQTAGFQPPPYAQASYPGNQPSVAGYQSPSQSVQPQTAGFQPPPYAQETSKPYSEPSAPYIGDETR